MQSYERTYGSETSGTQPSHCKRQAAAVSGSVVGDIVPVAPASTSRPCVSCNGFRASTSVRTRECCSRERRSGSNRVADTPQDGKPGFRFIARTCEQRLCPGAAGANGDANANPAEMLRKRPEFCVYTSDVDIF